MSRRVNIHPNKKLHTLPMELNPHQSFSAQAAAAALQQSANRLHSRVASKKHTHPPLTIAAPPAGVTLEELWTGTIIRAGETLEDVLESVLPPAWTDAARRLETKFAGNAVLTAAFVPFSSPGQILPATSDSLTLRNAWIAALDRMPGLELPYDDRVSGKFDPPTGGHTWPAYVPENGTLGGKGSKEYKYPQSSHVVNIRKSTDKVTQVHAWRLSLLYVILKRAAVADLRDHEKFKWLIYWTWELSNEPDINNGTEEPSRLGWHCDTIAISRLLTDSMKIARGGGGAASSSEAPRRMQSSGRIEAAAAAATPSRSDSFARNDAMYDVFAAGLGRRSDSNSSLAPYPFSGLHPHPAVVTEPVRRAASSAHAAPSRTNSDLRRRAEIGPLMRLLVEAVAEVNEQKPAAPTDSDLPPEIAMDQLLAAMEADPLEWNGRAFTPSQFPRTIFSDEQPPSRAASSAAELLSGSSAPSRANSQLSPKWEVVQTVVEAEGPPASGQWVPNKRHHLGRLPARLRRK